jgi:hypothetical protein
MMKKLFLLLNLGLILISCEIHAQKGLKSSNTKRVNSKLSNLLIMKVEFLFPDFKCDNYWLMV